MGEGRVPFSFVAVALTLEPVGSCVAEVVVYAFAVSSDDDGAFLLHCCRFVVQVCVVPGMYRATHDTSASEIFMMMGVFLCHKWNATKYLARHHLRHFRMPTMIPGFVQPATKPVCSFCNSENVPRRMNRESITPLTYDTVYDELY